VATAYAARRAYQLRAHAHSLKGAAATVGATALAEACAAIQDAVAVRAGGRQEGEDGLEEGGDWECEWGAMEVLARGLEEERRRFGGWWESEGADDGRWESGAAAGGAAGRAGAGAGAGSGAGAAPSQSAPPAQQAPPPARHAAAGHPPAHANPCAGHLAVQDWLRGVNPNLVKYGDALAGCGYEDTQLLAEASDEELREALAEVEMKKPHQKLVLKGIAALRAQSS
jgi:chemotaxis protein histidine kinase CheA